MSSSSPSSLFIGIREMLSGTLGQKIWYRRLSWLSLSFDTEDFFETPESSWEFKKKKSTKHMMKYYLFTVMKGKIHRNSRPWVQMSACVYVRINIDDHKLPKFHFLVYSRDCYHLHVRGLNTMHQFCILDYFSSKTPKLLTKHNHIRIYS